MPALASLCSQSHPKGAPQPGDTDAVKKEREKSHRWREFLEAKAVFALNTEADPLLALPRPLPIFHVFLEEPVPQPRAARVGTPVSPTARPLSPATLPWRALCHLRRALALPRQPPALAFSWVAVTRRLCCETKSDPLAPRQGREPGLLTPQPHPGQEGGDRSPGNSGGGAAPAGPGFGAIAPSRTPVRLRLRGRLLWWAPPPGTRSHLDGRCGCAQKWDRVGASSGDTWGASPGPAALGRCTWRDELGAGLFSFGEAVTDWDVGGTRGRSS